MTALTKIAKLVGLGSTGVLLYDAHHKGKARARQARVSRIANSIPDAYMNSISANGYSEA